MTLGSKNTSLNSEEILIALSICAATNPMAQVALEKLQSLKDVKLIQLLFLVLVTSKYLES